MEADEVEIRAGGLRGQAAPLRPLTVDADEGVEASTLAAECAEGISS